MQASSAIQFNLTIAERALAYLTEYGVKVIAAVLILVVGLWLAKKLTSLFTAALNKRSVDATLVGFSSSLIRGALVVFVVITAVGR